MLINEVKAKKRDISSKGFTKGNIMHRKVCFRELKWVNLNAPIILMYELIDVVSKSIAKQVIE